MAVTISIATMQNHGGHKNHFVVMQRVKDPDKSFHRKKAVDAIIHVGIRSLFKIELIFQVLYPWRVGSSLKFFSFLYFSINDVCCVLSCFDVEKR